MIPELVKIHFRFIEVKLSLLLASSKYFERSHSLCNAYQQFSFEKISFVVLEKIVNFMVNGEINPTMDSLEQLFYATAFLEMEDATKVLYDYLIHHLAAEDPAEIDKITLLMCLRIHNFVYSYEKRKKFGHNSGQHIMLLNSSRRVRHYSGPINTQFLIVIYFKRIMFDKAVLNLNTAALHSILNSTGLNISETEVLIVIKMWINHDFAARKYHFHRLLGCVRFDESIKVQSPFDHYFRFRCFYNIFFVINSRRTTSWKSSCVNAH